MANRFNFTTKLGLDAAGFKAGVNKVRGSLNSLKSSFLSLASALGAGLGFTQLISNIKTTATELSVAKNTLQNVSYVTKKYTDGVKELTVEVSNYQENLAFVKRLSEEYGQDLVALMTNFAQFTSACKKTDLALEDQKKVYEALTRAAAYYHMSADRTKDMMNAVTQMMSKGKIAAEELRRQLGNSLPGAFNIMAAAMDKSNAQLEEMMRNGEVIASERLPQFAAMLNTITQDAHFDSLQTSLNNFKNTWYTLVENSGAENFFKSIVDGSTDVVEWIGKNIKDLLNTIKSFVVTIASYKLFKGWEKQGQEYLANQARYLKDVEKEYQGVLNKFGVSPKGGKLLGLDIDDIKKKNITNPEDLRLIKQYNEVLLKISALKKELYGIRTMSENDIVAIKRCNAELDKMIAKANTAKATTKGIGVAWAGVKNIVKTVATTLKSMGIMAIVSAIIGAVTKVFTTIKDTRKEWERINSISSDYDKKVAQGQHSVTVQNQELEKYLAIAKDVNRSELERQTALDKVNELMGRINDNQFKLSDLEEIEGGYDKITAAVARWCEMTLLQKKIADAQSAQSDAEAKLETKRGELQISQAEDLERAKRRATLKGSMPTPDGMSYIEVPEQELEMTSTKTRQLTEEISQLESVIAKAKTDTGAFQEELVKLIAGNKGGDNKLEGLAKIIDEYDKKAKELGRQLEEDAITLKEYNSEMNNLLSNTFKEAAATGEVSMKEITDKMDANKALSSLEKWYLNIRDKAIEFSQKVIMDTIAESIIKDIDEALEEEVKELEKEFEKILENDNKRRQIDFDYAGATSDLKYQNSSNKRDGTFDYKKSRADIFSEEANIANENLDRVMDKIKELLDKEKNLIETTGQGLDSVAKQELESLREYARELSKNATTIEEAYRFEQIREDIKNFEKEMTSGVISGIENFATSMDRVVSGAQQLRDIMENVDSTGWEKIMGVVNYIFNILNAFTSILETVNTLTEISNMLAGARSLLDDKKNADAAIELEGTVAQIAAEETLAGIKAKEAAFETAITSNKVAQAEASLGVATALGIETAAWVALSAAAKDAAMAIAAANAAAAAGPAAPAAALAAATSVGAGLTTAMAAFAKGGIVGGNSTHGDRNLARVNSGEMILNKAQQGTLFNMLNGKGGLGGNVEFKIRGADLVGTINNHMSRKRG